MEEKQSASTQIQKSNRTAVYQILRTKGSLSKRDIMNFLKLSLPTVTQNINALCAEGLVTEASFQGNTGGRRAQLYKTNDEARFAIGLDITINHISAVIVDLRGNIIAQSRERFHFARGEAYAKELGNVVDSIIEQSHITDKDKILGVGIGVPGLVKPDNKTVFFGAILNFKGETCEEFSQFIPYKTALYNDAKASGFAECWSRGNVDSAFYVMLSTNIGGALIINNTVFQGRNIQAGEVGHLTIHADGIQCYCGQKGCADPYLSETVLSSHSDGSLDAFFQKLEAKDKETSELWNTYLDNLALTSNDLQQLLDMKVILGGYVGGYLGPYMDELRARAERRNSFDNDASYLEACRYTKNAIAAGSAINFIAKFIDSI